VTSTTTEDDQPLITHKPIGYSQRATLVSAMGWCRSSRKGDHDRHPDNARAAPREQTVTE
jgi:hypothetical protein